MTVAPLRVGELWWTPRRSRWLLVVVHIPLVVLSPVFTVLGFEGSRGNPWVVVPLGVALAGLQLWHSLTAAHGARPKVWPWSMVAMAALVGIPLFWWDLDWAATQELFIASAAMHLRGRTRMVAVAAPILGTTGYWIAALWTQSRSTVAILGFELFWLASLTILPAILYGSAWIVRALDEVYATRVELAQAAVSRERSRLSRDLHDLLGQSLTAVSLKGDLALALLPTDPRAAEEEIRGLAEVAREALRGTLTITRSEHVVSLRAEIERAAQLLQAAGVDTRLDVSLTNVPDEAGQVLAWATREGVTNLLRHSAASNCSITAIRQNGNLRLEITNDGVVDDHHHDEGSGLLGIGERAAELGGCTSAQLLDGGRFVLCVEVPEVAR